MCFMLVIKTRVIIHPIQVERNMVLHFPTVFVFCKMNILSCGGLMIIGSVGLWIGGPWVSGLVGKWPMVP